MTALKREKSGCKVGVELMVAQKTEGRVSRVSMSKLGTRANQTPIFTCRNKSRTQQISGSTHSRSSYIYHELPESLFILKM
jgi:hypothetical protein